MVESQCREVAHCVVLAGSNHKVVGLGLLQDKPHTLHIVFGIAPVAQRIEVAKVKLVLVSLGDTAGSKRDLAGDEILTTALALMVEENAIAAIHAVGFAVVLHDPEAVELGYAVG